MQGERRAPGRVAAGCALAAATYTLMLGSLTLLSSTTALGAPLARWLRLEDLLPTLPVVGLVAVSSAVVALVRARVGRSLAWAALACGVVGLLAFALALSAVVAGASVLDQL
jgi:hypothetical protein